MPEAAIWTIVPIVITGFGFIVYKHPVLTRNLIIKLAILWLFAFLYQTNIRKTKINTYISAEEIVTETKVYSGASDLDEMTIAKWDSIRIEDPTLEEYGAKYAKPEEENKIAKAFVVSRSIGMTRDKINGVIEKEIKEENIKKRNETEYLVWAGVCLAVFFGLSFIFEELHKPASKKKDKKSNEHTQ